MFNAETITNVANAAYVVAALLFILALAGLSKHETSKAGNAFGMAGMGVALIATIVLAINKQIEPLGLALLIAWRHKANIARLMTGTEPRIGQKT